MTLHYSAAEPAPALEIELYATGRLYRILVALLDGPLTTAQVKAAAFNPSSDKPHRESGKTHGALERLKAARMIRWSWDRVEITGLGRQALKEARAA